MAVYVVISGRINRLINSVEDHFDRIILVLHVQDSIHDGYSLEYVEQRGRQLESEKCSIVTNYVDLLGHVIRPVKQRSLTEPRKPSKDWSGSVPSLRKNSS